MSNSDSLLQLYHDALEAIPEAVAIFDTEQRFVFWNARFAAIYGEGIAFRVGVRFEDHLRSCVDRKLVPAAVGREAAWVAERMARFVAGTGAHEHRLGNGRWVRVQDRRLAHGGTIGIRADITEIKEREDSFRLLFDSNPVPMLVSCTETHRYLAVNDAAVAFYGYQRAAFLTLGIADIRPDFRASEIDDVDTHDEGKPLQKVISHRTATGEYKRVQISLRRLGYKGRPAILAAVFDLTDKVRMQEEVSSTRTFLTEVIDHIPAPIFAKDMAVDGRYVLFNRASETLFGRSRTAIIGQTDADLFEASVATLFRQQDRSALDDGPVESTEDEPFVRPDGTTCWIRTRKVALVPRSHEKPRFVLGVSEDVTARRAEEARMAHMAHHDALTGLPNRTLFFERLNTALSERAGEAMLTVMLLDLDGFKPINDTYGHLVGDEVLKQVAVRLRAATDDGDTPARLGGDEFVILRTLVAGPGEAALLAARLKAALAVPYRIGREPLVVDASIGIALGPFDGEDATVLLACADRALYRAKREGRNGICFARADQDQVAPVRATAAGEKLQPPSRMRV